VVENGAGLDKCESESAAAAWVLDHGCRKSWVAGRVSLTLCKTKCRMRSKDDVGLTMEVKAACMGWGFHEQSCTRRRN